MMSDSIVTPVRTRNHDGHHFPLRACKFGSSEHDGPIKIKVGPQRRWVQAVDSKNVGDVSFIVAHSAILFREVGRGFTRENNFDPSHFLLPRHRFDPRLCVFRANEPRF